MKKIIKISLVFFFLFSCNRNKLEVKEGNFKDYELTLNGPVELLPSKKLMEKYIIKLLNTKKDILLTNSIPRKIPNKLTLSF